MSHTQQRRDKDASRPRLIWVLEKVGRVFLVLCFLLGTFSAASAQRGDGAYRRFDADATLGIEAGANVLDSGSFEAGAELRLRILNAGGPFLAGAFGSRGVSLAVGVELRPLWPALFLIDMSTGRERLDLFLQSLSVDLGVEFAPLAGASDEFAGAEVAAAFTWGVGIGVPLLTRSRREGSLAGLDLRFFVRRTRFDRAQLGVGDRALPSVWRVGVRLALDFDLGVGASAEPARWR